MRSNKWNIFADDVNGRSSPDKLHKEPQLCQSAANVFTIRFKYTVFDMREEGVNCTFTRFCRTETC